MKLALNFFILLGGLLAVMLDFQSPFLRYDNVCNQSLLTLPNRNVCFIKTKLNIFDLSLHIFSHIINITV
jgi:hypothetical protein